MNHQLAVETRATERYMLGELDEESRSAFEEHYFSCTDCAADVKAAAVFVENATEILRAAPEPRRDPFRLSWWKPAFVPAALAASLTIGYFLPHPSASSPEGLVTTVAIPAGSRGVQAATRAIVVDEGSAYFLVRLDVADDVAAPRLLWRVRTASGRELRFRTARENQAMLPLRAEDFPVGQYELILSADAPDSAIIDRYPFTIQRP